MRKILLAALVFIGLHSTAQTQVAPVTQSTVNMGGGTKAITTDFIIDWSIGESTIIETFYGLNAVPNTIVGNRWNVTSGILQPYDNTHIIFNPLIPNWTNQEIRLYPVPAKDFVSIDFRTVAPGKISVQLYSRDGKFLGVKEFFQYSGNNTVTWNLTSYASGLYYFKILLTSPKGDVLKQGSFKVDKIK